MIDLKFLATLSFMLEGEPNDKWATLGNLQSDEFQSWY